MSKLAVVEGHVVNRGQGKRYWGSDHAIEVKTPQLWEFVSPPGCEIPPHVHHDDDEIHYLLEGSAVYTVGGRTLEVAPGGAVFLPRQVPHALTFGPDGGRWLWLTRPELAGLLSEIGIPADEPDAQRRALEVPEELLLSTFAKYGMEFLVAEEG